MARTRARRTASAENFLPEKLALPALREAAAGCKGCELWKLGTQTVFGEGPESAPLVLVGEQPGDQEDQAEDRSSARPDGCSTRLSQKPGSIGLRPI
jgi:hypothetical protein